MCFLTLVIFSMQDLQEGVGCTLLLLTKERESVNRKLSKTEVGVKNP